MPTPSAVLRGVTATTPRSTGAANNAVGYSPNVAGWQGGQSPLVASYQQWTAGRPYGPPLPRPPSTFLTSAFGPLAPIMPVGIDAPDPSSGRPEPRIWEYPVAWNMPIGVPGSEGLKLASFANLRTIADTYSVARACIEVRKNEILGLGWDIVPTKDAAAAMRNSPRAHKDFAKRRNQFLKFFSNGPDTDYHTIKSWLGAVLEEVFAVDALSLYLWPSRGKRKGLLGSDFAKFSLIAGDTVRPLINVRGGKPRPPAPAYQQYLYGVPRVDLLTAIADADLDAAEMGPMEAQYRADQLLYLPYVARTWTPYGFPPIEQALVPVLSGLQRQKYQLDYFQEGTVPAVYISAGDPNATPNQLRELQDALNALAGDPAWKHKIIVLPGGSKVDPMHPAALADQFDEIVMTQVLMAFDVMPMELGISPKVSTTQSPGAANQMAKASGDINARKALKPTLLWLKESIFDFLIQRVCGQTDMEWMWEGMEVGEDEAAAVDLLVQEIGHGLKSIDEGRVERGEQPWGLPITSDPVFFAATGVMPLGNIDPSTGQPSAVQPPAPGQTPPPGGGAGQVPGNGAQTSAPPAGAAKPGGAASPHHQAAAASGPGSSANPSNPARSSSGPAPTPDVAAPSTPPTKTPSTKALTPRPHPNVDLRAGMVELDLVRRRLRKGRSLTGWATRALPGWILEAVKADTAAGAAAAEAVGWGRLLLKAAAGTATPPTPDTETNAPAEEPPPSQTGADLRDAAIAAAMAGIVLSLTALAGKLRTGQLSTPTYVDQATHLMRDGILAGLRAGAAQALSNHPDTAPVGGWADPGPDGVPSALGAVLDTMAEHAAEQQRPYLIGLLQDVYGAMVPTAADTTHTGMPAPHPTAPTPEETGIATPDGIAGKWTGRYSQYAQAVRAAYEQGHGTTALALHAPGEIHLVWHTLDPHACRFCRPRNGKTYTEETLPCWPGTGGYGGPECEGGPQCRCTITVEVAHPDSPAVKALTKDWRTQPRDGEGRWTDGTPTPTHHGRHRRDRMPAEQVEAQETRRRHVAAAREAFVAALPDRATPGALTSPRQRAEARDKARREIAEELSRKTGKKVWPSDVPARMVAERLHGTSRPTRAQRLTQGLHGKSHHGDGDGSEHGHGGQGHHSGHSHTGHSHGDQTHGDQTHEVYAYLARHYPARVLEWVKDAHWHNPTDVPLDQIDMARRPGGARNQAKVDELAHSLDDGHKLPPIVLVRTPDSPPYEIADGWHRTLAAVHTGRRRISAWIGDVDTTTGPWGTQMNQAKLNTTTSARQHLPDDECTGKAAW